VGEEFEDGTRSSNVSLAEAHLTLLTLPFGTQLKLGQMRTRLGLLNESHAHDRPFIDTPSVLVRFFGDEGLVEKGAELVWVAPLPVYLQAIVGLFDGDNEVAFGRGSLRDPLVTRRLRTFLELGDTSALQLGVSGATGTTEARQRASYGGVDAAHRRQPQPVALLPHSIRARHGRHRRGAAGIPPTPEHLARLIGRMKTDRVKVLILEPWGDRKLAERLAGEAGAQVVLLAPGVGAAKGTDTYLDWLEYNVTTLARALR
jgi:hypothetical protein